MTTDYCSGGEHSAVVSSQLIKTNTDYLPSLLTIALVGSLNTDYRLLITLKNKYLLPLMTTDYLYNQILTTSHD